MLTLEQWDYQVGHHLRSIATESGLIVMHADAMTRRPDWETRAEHEIVNAVEALERAAARVRRALRTIGEKPLDD